ncbi:zinc-ribbon domain containing protein [Planctopirus ephydatiae]
MCSGSFFWRCVDCGRDFVFFAREQQHWFETLKPAGIAWAALLRQTDKQHPAHEHP